MARYLPLCIAIYALFAAGSLAAADRVEDPVALPDAFSEAPDLVARVASGDLEPVAKRMGSAPKCVVPVEGIGRYGGIWKRAHLGPRDAYGAIYFTHETLLTYTPDYSRIDPNVCRAFEWNDDYTQVTFYLRPGMRWSDGAPFTADDFVFWYETLQNDVLHPVWPNWFERGGERAVLEKIDTTTFRIRFARPYGAFTDFIAGLWNPTLYLPRHHLKNYLPKYRAMEEIEEETRKEGLDHWTSLFRYKSMGHKYRGNPEVPTIEAWRVQNDISQSIQRWRRNPYYWKVDPSGNQLPYLDGIEQVRESDQEQILLMAAAGEIDLQGRRIGGINEVGTKNYPFLMERRQKGRYRLILRNQDRQNKYSLFFNFHHEDPVLHRLFNDLRFRIALSVGIDREEINEFFLEGLGKPSQIVPVPDSPWYDEKIASLHTEHDVAKASRLLDEVGLDQWDDAHRFRLRPSVTKTTEKRRVVRDGREVEEDVDVLRETDEMETLSLIMKVRGENVEPMQLVADQWAELGIKVTVTPIETGLWYSMIRAGTYEITSEVVNTGWRGRFPINNEIVPQDPYNRAAPKWGLWVGSHGEAGIEPPPWVLEMVDTYECALGLPACVERQDLIKTIFRIYNTNLLQIGVLMNARESNFVVASDRFRNVPDPLPNLVCVPPALFYIDPDRPAPEKRK